MDQDGLFLMLKMCNACSHNKGSWKKCMTRKHNPRMSTVRNEELAYGHRQCVKPDQSITIYKLRDNETNEEFLEFDEHIVFQTACDDCLNIKTCLDSGHRLVDWRPTFAGGRAAGDPVDSPGANKQDGETSACDSKETSSDSGSAGATAPAVAVAEGGGVCGKGKTKARGARAGEEEQAGERSTNKRKSTGPKSTPPSKSKKTSASRPAASPKNAPQPSIKARKPKPKARGVKRLTSPSAAARVDTGDGSSDELERPPMMEIDTSMSAADVDERERTTSHKRRGRKGKGATPAVVTPSPKTDSLEAFGAAAAPATKSDDAIAIEGGGDGGRNIGDRVRSSPRKSPASRRGSAGGTSTLPDVVPRKALDLPGVTKPPPPKTVAEKLELVKAEEAKLLRQFKETHKRYAQEEAEKRAEMERFRRAGEEALRTMQAAKEEALRLIAEERNRKGSARRALIQERLKELEAAEEAARVEARERDARLQAERERLARNYKFGSLLSDTAASDTAPAPDPFGGTEGEPEEPEWIVNAWGCRASAQPTASAGSPESSADPAEQTRSGGDVVDRTPARRDGSSVKYVASQSAGGVKHPHETVFRRELAAETAGIGRADEITGKDSASGESRLASDAVKVAGSAPAGLSPVRRGRNHTRGSAPGLDDPGCCADRKPAQAFFSRGGAVRRVGGGTDETAGVEMTPLGVCTVTPSAIKGSTGETCLDRFRNSSTTETLVGAFGGPVNPEMNINGSKKQGNGGGLNGVVPSAELEGKTSCAVTAR